VEPGEALGLAPQVAVTLAGVAGGARRLTPAQFRGVSKNLFFPLFAIGTMTIVLQLYNMAVVNWFWPFFAGIVVDLIAGMLQFKRLVLLPQGNQPAA
jgi:hypothetical protein